MTLSAFAILMTLVATIFCILWYRKDEEVRRIKAERDDYKDKFINAYEAYLKSISEYIKRDK